jgi:hypothetical protein
MCHKSDLKEPPFLTVLKITGHNKGNQLRCIKADVLKEGPFSKSRYEPLLNKY